MNAEVGLAGSQALSSSIWKHSCRRQALGITASSAVPVKAPTFSMPGQVGLWDTPNKEPRN